MVRSRTCLVLIACGVLIVSAASGGLFSAGFLLQPPRVISTQPPDHAADVLVETPIQITFSTPMERDATGAALQLLPHLSGSWEWSDDRTVRFVPESGLPISATVTVQIGAEARSRWGPSLAEPFRLRFNTITRPVPIGGDPPLQARFVYTPNRVKLSFSRPLDAAAVEEGLQISPPLPHQQFWWDGAALYISGFFAPATRYQITLPGGITDAEYGIPLGRDLVWSFTTATQYPNFSILNRDRVLTFAAGTPVNIPTQFTNVSRLDAMLIPIAEHEYQANLDAPFETWFAFEPTRRAIRTRRVPTQAQLDRYMRAGISFADVPRGTYLLKVTTPEGPSDKLLVRVK